MQLRLAWRGLAGLSSDGDFSIRTNMDDRRISREGGKGGRDEEEIAAVVVDCAFKLHKETGPGLLESVYEVVLARMLEAEGFQVRRQVPIPIRLMGLNFEEGFRADLVVDDALLVELKCIETLLPIHSRQVVTYLRLLNFPLGLLINFNATTFKQGVKRVINNLHPLPPSRLSADEEPADFHNEDRNILPAKLLDEDNPRPKSRIHPKRRILSVNSANLG
jgi:GxxExxY protein